MNNFSTIVFIHWSLANSAARRAIAAHGKYAQGKGKNIDPVITVMRAGEVSYWKVCGVHLVATECPSRVIGSVNLRVSDSDGLEDQPCVEVGE